MIHKHKGEKLMKKALITGITGQDGSYLAEFLLEKGYEVHGITRRASISNTARIDHLIANGSVKLHDGDLSDSSSLIRIISIVQPDEIYNLAAQSHVQVSFDVPEYSGDVDALGAGVNYKVGNLFSSDTFYDDAASLSDWRKMGVLAVEMESAALYMNAARAGKNALCICTISDCPFTGESCTAEERQNTFTDMMEIALKIAEIND